MRNLRKCNQYYVEVAREKNPLFSLSRELLITFKVTHKSGSRISD